VETQRNTGLRRDDNANRTQRNRRTQRNQGRRGEPLGETRDPSGASRSLQGMEHPNEDVPGALQTGRIRTRKTVFRGRDATHPDRTQRNSTRTGSHFRRIPRRDRTQQTLGKETLRREGPCDGGGLEHGGLPLFRPVRSVVVPVLFRRQGCFAVAFRQRQGAIASESGNYT
jgi:hypothetical protein